VTRRRRRPVSRRAAGYAVAVAGIALVAWLAFAGLGGGDQASSGPISPSGYGSTPGGHSTTGRSSGHQSPGGLGTISSPDPEPPGTVAAGHGPAARLIPTSGAYLGAYVEPAVYTPAGEIAAVRSFQGAVGAPVTLVHTYHPWGSVFPDSADRYFVRSGKVLLLTWGGNPDTRKIIAGRYDAEIRARAQAIKRLGRPILLEFRHEMDRPNLQWAIHGPKDYIAAWDHIRAIFTQVGALNVGWVWCPTGWGFEDGRAQPFYPGNNEVDWVCADVYSPTTTQTLQEVAYPFLTWARQTHKPVLIGEFGVTGRPWAWSRWLLAAGELAELNPQIRGMAYFDANGTDSQGRPFRYWLGGNGPALQAFGQMLGWQIFHPVFASPQ
jgi:Glycosyl hydrolase family 26